MLLRVVVVGGLTQERSSKFTENLEYQELLVLGRAGVVGKVVWAEEKRE